MSAADVEFSRRVVDFGVEPLDLNTIPMPMRSIYESLLRTFKAHAALRAEETNPGHVCFIGFVDSTELNAFAGINDGDVIAINEGAMLRLLSLFNYHFSRPEGFGWLGPVSGITASDIRPYDFNSYRLSQFGGVHYDVAIYSAFAAMLFLFMHELGHVWNGHTSLVEKSMPFGRIDEVLMANSANLGGLDFQTFEMDADGYAMPNLFGALFTKHRPLEAINEEWEDRWGAGATQIIITIFAVYSMFKLFDDARGISDIDVASHPPASLRMEMLVALAMAAISRGREISESEAREMIDIGVLLSDTAMPSDAIFSRGAEGLAMPWPEFSYRYAGSLIENWKKLRPLLDPLKRGGNLPPIQDWVRWEDLQRAP